MIIPIGHLYSGLWAQQFTKLYPFKVKTLILMDSTSEDLKRLDSLNLPVLNEQSSDEEWYEECSTYANLSGTALNRSNQSTLTENQKRLPSPTQERLIKFQRKPILYKAMRSVKRRFEKLMRYESKN
ncbi:hypothetical protein BBH88_11110 [Planococcus antarcticus DSM 14505]|uniref:Uncharacterized protein n=1 Tax=Planococcus antarcticus DSM 14505 TaxID=1185653 RepID=A0ABM6D612_9BACL|nr:hypothetical protein BBH88_11110 [Planococcus antarcticus DSM 14505]